MTKTFNTELKCGCLIADDTGTKEEPNGDGALIPCHCEYGTKEMQELHNKEWEEYNKTQDNATYPESRSKENE